LDDDDDEQQKTTDSKLERFARDVEKEEKVAAASCGMWSDKAPGSTVTAIPPSLSLSLGRPCLFPRSLYFYFSLSLSLSLSLYTILDNVPSSALDCLLTRQELGNERENMRFGNAKPR
jgi:hypothetical protein